MACCRYRVLHHRLGRCQQHAGAPYTERSGRSPPFFLRPVSTTCPACPVPSIRRLAAPTGTMDLTSPAPEGWWIQWMALSTGKS